LESYGENAGDGTTWELPNDSRSRLFRIALGWPMHRLIFWLESLGFDYNRVHPLCQGVFIHVVLCGDYFDCHQGGMVLF
jgi:hypothetical protein